jgi:ABC-type glycerol-3-phosphate transport system substrate-binding protein
VRIGIASAMLALLLVVVAAGCGGHSSQAAERKAVTQSIERVDAVEQQLRFPLLKIEKTYRSFSTHPGTMKKMAPQFATAEATLEHELRLRRRRLHHLGRQ